MEGKCGRGDTAVSLRGWCCEFVMVNMHTNVGTCGPESHVKLYPELLIGNGLMSQTVEIVVMDQNIND
jgi:hypothetical protein